MDEIGIGELARRAGLRPSAIRYYESQGLVSASRRSGRRVYSADAVDRLALIGFAKSAGFSLDEIRLLLFGFPEEMPAGARWNEMAGSKLKELDSMARRIEEMRGALQRIAHCRCRDLDQCARGIAAKRCR